MTEVVAWAASNGDRSENADYQYGKRRLRQIDGRIRFLTKRIESAEVVDPETPRAGRRRRGHSLEHGTGANGTAQLGDLRIGSATLYTKQHTAACER